MPLSKVNCIPTELVELSVICEETVCRQGATIGMTLSRESGQDKVTTLGVLPKLVGATILTTNIRGYSKANAARLTIGLRTPSITETGEFISDARRSRTPIRILFDRPSPFPLFLTALS